MEDIEKSLLREGRAYLASLVENRKRLDDIHYYLSLSHLLLPQEDKKDHDVIKNCQERLEEYRGLYIKQCYFEHESLARVQYMQEKYYALKKLAKDSEIPLEDIQIMDFEITSPEIDKGREILAQLKRKLEIEEFKILQYMMNNSLPEKLATKISLRQELQFMYVLEGFRTKYHISDSVPYPY